MGEIWPKKKSAGRRSIIEGTVRHDAVHHGQLVAGHLLHPARGPGREVVGDEGLVQRELVPVLSTTISLGSREECNPDASNNRASYDDVEIGAEPDLELATVQQPEELRNLAALPADHVLHGQLWAARPVPRPVRQEVRGGQAVLEDGGVRAGVAHAGDRQRVLVDLAQVLEVALVVCLQRLPALFAATVDRQSRNNKSAQADRCCTHDAGLVAGLRHQPVVVHLHVAAALRTGDVA